MRGLRATAQAEVERLDREDDDLSATQAWNYRSRSERVAAQVAEALYALRFGADDIDALRARRARVECLFWLRNGPRYEREDRALLAERAACRSALDQAIAWLAVL